MDKLDRSHLLTLKYIGRKNILLCKNGHTNLTPEEELRMQNTETNNIFQISDTDNR